MREIGVFSSHKSDFLHVFKFMCKKCLTYEVGSHLLRGEEGRMGKRSVTVDIVVEIA